MLSMPRMVASARPPRMSLHRAPACAIAQRALGLLGDVRAAAALTDRVLDGPARELAAAPQPGLVANPTEVVLHGARRRVDRLADLAVGEPLGDQPQDLVLTRGQRRPQRAGVALRGARVALDEVTRQRRRDHGAAAVHADHGVTQLGAAGALGEVARGPGADGRHQALGVLAGGDDQHAAVGHVLAQGLEHEHAAHVRQVQVEQHHVGLQLARQRNALAARRGLADDVDRRVARERGRHPLADEREVVDEQDADVHAGTSSGAGVPAGTRSRRSTTSRTPVPRPGSDSMKALPPMSRRRRIMLPRIPWPALAGPGRKPTPSSSILIKARSPRTAHRTVARPAPECRRTLASASRVAAASSLTAWAAGARSIGPAMSRTSRPGASSCASLTASWSAATRSHATSAALSSRNARSWSAAAAATLRRWCISGTSR